MVRNILPIWIMNKDKEQSTNKEQNLRKVAQLLLIFLTTPDEVGKKNAKMMQSNHSDN